MSSLFFKFANQAPLYPKFVFAVHMIKLIARHFDVIAVAVINWIVFVDFSAPIVPITAYNFLEFVLHEIHLEEVL